ncbi:hypothetical protein [Nannocystis pusilla]|uniref:hypothetical protein n=1 Tax=Nannocystis pusilla TaxID=889268 RepID=UPI003DA3CA1E
MPAAASAAPVPTDSAPATASGSTPWGSHTGARRPPRPRRPVEAQVRPRTPEQLQADAIAEATRERARITARAAEIAQRHNVDASARWLGVQAQATLDPFVFLMAAETALDGATTEEQLQNVIRLADDAVLLAETPPILRIEPDQVERVRLQSEAIRTAVAKRRSAAERRAAQAQLQRRANRQLIAGGTLLTLAAAGVGMLAGGAVKHGRYHDRLADSTDTDYDVAAWEDYYDHGSRMIVAGTIIATAGVVIAAPLLTLGLRDRRKANETVDRLTFGVRPGLTNLTFVLRF